MLNRSLVGVVCKTGVIGQLDHFRDLIKIFLAVMTIKFKLACFYIASLAALSP